MGFIIVVIEILPPCYKRGVNVCGGTSPPYTNPRSTWDVCYYLRLQRIEGERLSAALYSLSEGRNNPWRLLV